jgi:inner membrane transporter RhtA
MSEGAAQAGGAGAPASGSGAPATDAGILARAPSGALVVGAITSAQFGSSLAATLLRQLTPGGTAFVRLASAAIVLLVLWRPRVRGRTSGELLLVGVFGLVLAGLNLSFYEALERIPLGIAVAIEFVGPLAVAVAGSRRRVDVLWVLSAVAGILALTGGGGHGVSALGVAYALAAGCMWGTYILLNARLGQAFEGSTGVALVLCVAAVVVLPVGIATGGGHLLDPESLALGAGVGMLSSAIPYSLEVEALRRIATSVFGVLMSLEPAVAALAGFLVLGQQLGVRALVGIALVVIASVGASRRRPDAALSV